MPFSLLLDLQEKYKCSFFPCLFWTFIRPLPLNLNGECETGIILLSLPSLIIKSYYITHPILQGRLPYPSLSLHSCQTYKKRVIQEKILHLRKRSFSGRRRRESRPLLLESCHSWSPHSLYPCDLAQHLPHRRPSSSPHRCWWGRPGPPAARPRLYQTTLWKVETSSNLWGTLCLLVKTSGLQPFWNRLIVDCI